VRNVVRVHGEQLGLALASDHADAADWELEGLGGGLYCTGRGAMTGRPGDLLVADDLLRDQAEANSETVLSGIHEWWATVPVTRLAPGAPAVANATRWVEDDIPGRLAGEGWPAVNIPAQADGQTPDALGRPAGEWLVSARGRTAGDWEAKRKAVGERTWASLYQGRPAPLEGGIFKTAWFDMWRTDTVPPGCEAPTVVVDPADNEGSGDEAGIVVATRHPGTGYVYLLDDLSAHLTVAQWARRALLACARAGAPVLAYERSLSQLPKRVREAWTLLHRQASALQRSEGDQERAAVRLTAPDDGQDARAVLAGQLAEIVDDVAAVLALGPVGPRLREIVAKGSKTTRMQLVSPLFETGRVRMVGRHPQIEHQLATFQVGMDSPDRADAAVHAAALLAGVSGVASLGRASERVPTRSVGSRASSRITRSTRR
jgi:hypothetical protein